MMFPMKIPHPTLGTIDYIPKDFQDAVEQCPSDIVCVMSDRQMGVSTCLAIVIIDQLKNNPWLKIGVVSLRARLVDQIKELCTLNKISINITNIEKPKPNVKYDLIIVDDLEFINFDIDDFIFNRSFLKAIVASSGQQNGAMHKLNKLLEGSKLSYQQIITKHVDNNTIKPLVFETNIDRAWVDGIKFAIGVEAFNREYMCKW